MTEVECREADRDLFRFLGKGDQLFHWLEQQSQEVQEHYHLLRRSYSIAESLRRTADHYNATERGEA